VASHEETLAGLQQGNAQCGNLHGVVQNASQMAAELRTVLQHALGTTDAYGSVAGPCEALTTQLSAAAQTVAQISQSIDEMMARFQRF
jgi:methyl-accepting chemotaxis protein